MSRANFWTASNVKKMGSDDLVRWNNEIFELMEQAKKYDMPLKSEKAFHLIQGELKRRRMI